MNKRNISLTALACLLLTFSQLSAHAAAVKSFFVDMTIVTGFMHGGAVDIKIYAAQDNENKMYYIMVGIDDNGVVIPGQIYRQNETWDCPPTCDLLPTELQKGGANITAKVANGLIDNYLNNHSSVQNVVLVCAYSLGKMVEQGYDYMRVTFENTVQISGLKEDGSIRLFAPFSNSCNTFSRSGLVIKNE